MTDDVQRDEFLAARARYAMLTTLRRDGTPTTLPVWFDWDGVTVSMFCAVNSSKLIRIDRDPRISVLVTNGVDEPEYWVAFDGRARVESAGGFELAEALADRYWDMSDPQRVQMLDEWRKYGDVGLRKITLEPSTIRTYAGD